MLNRSIFCFLLIATIHVFAQKVQKDTVSTTVILFGENEDLDGFQKKKDPKNIVKLDLLGGAFGKTEIFFERHLFDFFSVQAGAGITYRNFVGGGLYGLIGRDYDDESPNWNGPGEVNSFDDYGTYTGFQYRKGSLGYIVSVIPKFYPGDDALEGFNLGFHLSYAQFRYKAQKIQPDGEFSMTDFQKEKQNSIRFTLDIGGQTVFKPLTLEYGLGFGLTSDKHTRLDTGYSDLSGNAVYMNKTHTFKALKPLFHLYLIFGGGF